MDAEGKFLEYESDVVDVGIPVLFGLDNMKNLKWYTNEATNQFGSHTDENFKIQLVPILGYLYLE